MRTSLLARLTWWFAASLLALYGISATLVYLYAAAQARQYAVLTLKTEAEALAARVADGGGLDAPELAEAEESPFPMWMRVRRNGQVLAETPGIPTLPSPLEPEEQGEVVTVSVLPVKPPYMMVRHKVGGLRNDEFVEAIGSMAPLARDRQRLGWGLVLVGLVVIPLSALGGRALAKRALRPIQDLVAEIRGLDPSHLHGLRLHQGGVEEVSVLSRAFNTLLDQLEESVDRMRRFTADASHEIRNPLTVLRTGLEVTLRRERTAREYQELLRENLQEIERLHAVVEGILLLSRDVPGNGFHLARASLDLGELVRTTAAAFEVFAAERGIRIDVEAPPSLEVNGDAGLLRLAVFNLLDNALKHSPDRETVRIEAQAREDGVAVVVADRGPGVKPEDRDRVFERFFRGGPASGSGVGGIGLSVVRWVAEAHGGAARLLASDGGAVFEILLPR